MTTTLADLLDLAADQCHCGNCGMDYSDMTLDGLRDIHRRGRACPACTQLLRDLETDMADYRYYMVDVACDDDHFASSPEGDLFACDVPETHFATRQEAEEAATKCRNLHPDCRVEVNGKLY